MAAGHLRLMGHVKGTWAKHRSCKEYTDDRKKFAAHSNSLLGRAHCCLALNRPLELLLY
jgi:hypothetical protein